MCWYCEFDNNVNSIGMSTYMLFVLKRFGDYWSLRFCAIVLVIALFVFYIT